MLAKFSTDIMISLFKMYKKIIFDISILSNFILRITNTDFAAVLQQNFTRVQNPAMFSPMSQGWQNNKELKTRSDDLKALRKLTHRASLSTSCA